MQKTVLITGAGRGLGRALAIAFGERGYPLILHARNPVMLDETCNLIQRDIVKVIGDLREPKTIEVIVSIAKEYEHLVLINNAGMWSTGINLDDELHDEIEKPIEIINVNILATFQLTQRIYSSMSRHKCGTIININSVCALDPKKGRAIYSGVRWGLRGFTDALRQEACDKNIAVIGVYLSRVKSRPEYGHGMEMIDVCRKIIESYESGLSGMLVIDERPEEHKKRRDTEYG
jgi:short-subunit dehydrogenase